jgi:DNA repair protein RecO (recombination protein O)
MPLRRTSAIVLRTYRVGEADKICVFFTLEYGKLRGMARAARRPRSRFGASLEIGTEVELTFFEKPSRELVSVDRCDIILSHFSKLSDPVLASTLEYVADLLDSFVLEREANKPLYRLLRVTVSALTRTERAETTARYFEAWLLRLVGVYPRRKSCANCGRSLVEEGARYLPDVQRLGCRRCLDKGIPLSQAALRLVEEMWRSRPDEVNVSSNSNANAESKVNATAAGRALRELSQFHAFLVREHLDKDLRSRQVLESVLKGETGAVVP